MSEVVNVRANRRNLRWQLLATASAMALLSLAYSTEAFAADDDADKPVLWLELGGQLSRLDEGQEVFAPVFKEPRPAMFSPSQEFERMPLYSADESGKLSFQPAGSDWVLSASVRFGRSISRKDVNQQTYPKRNYFYYSLRGVHYVETNIPVAAHFADTNVQNSQTHIIVDFQAGKDVGVGMFGSGSSSVFNVGVRFAQFNTRSNIAIKSDPDWQQLFKYASYPAIGVNHEKIVYASPYHSNAASIIATRSFHGVGPSISWNASAPVLGNSKSGVVAFDWGLGVAVIFGRQRAKVSHQTTSLYASKSAFPPHRSEATVVSHTATAHTRARTATVPNVGGFAGMSFQIQNFKVSAGYRADLFFGAMDGGIDTRKSENVGFYGPFATISVGLGG